ncbi:CMD domain-containing protein [Variovorax saccharolyticus]|uniref:CMD domain-containing protein n=1 Tax=Variovorax saccharolyticus TaxID=3053516 RepID=UPI0025756CF0|nr:CMD domain protein [Variovorax sp. J31P216]MDM0025369.1 CMD domain protein [Variovorax sp. J31P216]
MTLSSIPDVIDHLTGTVSGDALDTLRANRPQARLHAQQSYLALFEPAAPAAGEASQFTGAERFTVAVFVAGLHGQAELAAFYAEGLSRVGAAKGGARLAAALVHAHLLVLHPRDARAADLQALLDAGWSTTDIVTLSQLVAFLSFQIRVVVGLRSLAAQAAPATAA